MIPEANNGNSINFFSNSTFKTYTGVLKPINVAGKLINTATVTIIPIFYIGSKHTLHYSNNYKYPRRHNTNIDVQPHGIIKYTMSPAAIHILLKR